MNYTKTEPRFSVIYGKWVVNVNHIEKGIQWAVYGLSKLSAIDNADRLIRLYSVIRPDTLTIVSGNDLLLGLEGD
jgi:hypothetical protein